MYPGKSTNLIENYSNFIYKILSIFKEEVKDKLNECLLVKLESSIDESKNFKNDFWQLAF